MKKSNYLFILILILAALAGGLIIWRLFIYRPSSITAPAPTPSPTPAIPILSLLPSPADSPKEIGDSPADLLKSLKTRFPLIEYLPYKTARYSIDYQAPLYLKIRVNSLSEISQIEKEVFSWMKSKGVDPATHQINWVTPEP